MGWQLRHFCTLLHCVLENTTTAKPQGLVTHFCRFHLLAHKSKGTMEVLKKLNGVCA